MGVFLPGGIARYEGLDVSILARPALAVRSEGDAVVFPEESRPDGEGETLTLHLEGHLSCWISPRTWRAAALTLADPRSDGPAADA